MSHPVKHEDLNWITSRLNRALEPLDIKFIWSRRYGYYALDYTSKDNGTNTHRSGLSKNEVYQILHGMSIIAEMTMDHRRSKAQDFIDYALGK